MNTTARVAIGISGVIVTILILAFGSYMSAASNGNKSENMIEAVWEDNENVLSTMYQTITEMAQVPTMAKNDIKDIIETALTARYGEDGSKATWQWIKEQNPSVDPGLYTKLSQTIEAKRNEFKIAQTKLIDVKRQYKNELGGPWSGIWLRLAGYPTLNVGYPRGSADDYSIVTTDKANAAFETKRDSGINLLN